MRSLLIYGAIFALSYTTLNLMSYNETIGMLSEGETPSQIERWSTSEARPFLLRNHLGLENLGREIAYLKKGKEALEGQQ